MSPTSPHKDNCCAIIVLFYPDGDFIKRLQAWSSVFHTLIFVSNGISDAQREVLNSQDPRANVIVLIENSENYGIAHALNQGLNYALANQFSWVVTFDQDTLVYSFLLEELQAIYDQETDKPVMLGCNYWHAVLNRSFLAENARQRCVERKTLICSGTLLWTGLLALVGHFREDYFIDSVDHEFALRVRSYGFRIWISTRVLMQQTIGLSNTSQRIPWLQIPEHTASRKYYIFRNALTTVFCYYRHEPTWCLRQFIRLAIEWLAVVIYEQDKANKLRAMLLGISHAVSGKMGVLNNHSCINPGHVK